MLLEREPFEVRGTIASNAAGHTAEEPCAGRSAAPDASGLTFSLAGLRFSSPPFVDAHEQRLHFKTDLHRLNVKRGLRGQAILTEGECESSLLEQQDDDASSLSGSGVLKTVSRDT